MKERVYNDIKERGWRVTKRKREKNWVQEVLDSIKQEISLTIQGGQAQFRHRKNKNTLFPDTLLSDLNRDMNS